MNNRAAQGMLVAALLFGVAPVGARAADTVKAGKWQFTTQMQLPPLPQSAAGAQPGGGSGQPMTRTACIDPAHPIPVEAQCKLDDVTQNGGTVTWAMTCNMPQGPVHSTGSARYAGETMEANLTARVPGPNGQPVDAPGRITGRYLGPCDER
jgi:hypothetical protein